MASRSKYTGRYSGIGKMLTRPWLQAPCIAAAQKIQTAAEAIAPVGDPETDPHSGRYKAGFVTVPHTKNVPFRGKPRMRAGARLMNKTPEARIVEYGNTKVPRYSVLRNAIDAVKASHRG